MPLALEKDTPQGVPASTPLTGPGVGGFSDAGRGQWHAAGIQTG